MEPSGEGDSQAHEVERSATRSMSGAIGGLRLRTRGARKSSLGRSLVCPLTEQSKKRTTRFNSLFGFHFCSCFTSDSFHLFIFNLQDLCSVDISSLAPSVLIKYHLRPCCSVHKISIPSVLFIFAPSNGWEEASCTCLIVGLFGCRNLVPIFIVLRRNQI